MGRPLRELARTAGLTAFRYLPLVVRRIGVRLLMPSFTVGAVVLLRRGDEVVLVHQRHTGAWGLPGGLLERGETPAAAASRELAEELAIHLPAEELGEPTVFVDPRRRRVDVIFRVDADPDLVPRPGPTPEVMEAGWFRSVAMPAVTGPAAQIMRSVGITVPRR